MLSILLPVGGFVFLITTWVLIHNEQYGVAIVTALVALTLFVSNMVRLFYEGEHKKPEQTYEQKVKDMQKAERELQKFLIDHPEFKEAE